MQKESWQVNVDADIDSLLETSEKLSDMAEMIAASHNLNIEMARKMIYSRMDYWDAHYQAEQRMADAIDGYDLDDLGESSDY